MATDKKGDGRTVKLRRVRLSFSDSLKDKKATVENGEPKHALNLILESEGKEFATNKAAIMAAIQKSGEVTWKKPEAYTGIQKDDPKRLCFRKGERFKNREGEPYAGYAGNYGLSCGTPSRGQKRPKLFDRHRRPVEENDILDVFYSGCYVDAFVSFYGTDKGGRGIFCTVDAIRSHQEGEHMGGGAQVDADDFDAMEDDDSFEGAGGTVSDDDEL